MTLCTVDDSCFRALRFDHLTYLAIGGRDDGLVHLRSFDALLLACPVLQTLRISGYIRVDTFKCDAKTINNSITNLDFAYTELCETEDQDPLPVPWPYTADAVADLAVALPNLTTLWFEGFGPQPLPEIAALVARLEADSAAGRPLLQRLQNIWFQGGVHENKTISAELIQRLIRALPCLDEYLDEDMVHTKEEEAQLGQWMTTHNRFVHVNVWPPKGPNPRLDELMARLEVARNGQFFHD